LSTVLQIMTSATLRHADGDLARSIRQNAERLGWP